MIDWSLHPVGGENYLMEIAAALVLVALLALGPARAKTSRGRRWALVGLRALVIVLVVSAMLRPTVVYTRIKKQSATLVVLADQSRSMSVRDEANDKSRFEALAATLGYSREALRELAADFELRAYTFDAEPHLAEVAGGQIALGDTPNGEQTAIGFALDAVLRQEAGKRLLGIILLSDGAQRAYPPCDVLPQTAASRLKHMGCPLYAVRFGQPRGLGQVQDVAVTELLADPLVFVKTQLVVNGQVRIDGQVNREIPVQLLAETSPGKMEVVAQKNVKATSDGALVPIRFTYVPENAGEIKLTLEAAAQPGELVTTNNRLSTFVNVLKGGIRILYLESFPPRPEQKFLVVDSLGSSRDIHVDARNLNLAAPQTRPKDLGELMKPGKCDVYILGDIDSSAFTQQELTDLAEAVDKGAGLIMLGGTHSFGPGGYADTPLGEVLPVRMNRLERQPLDGPISKDLHLPGPLRMRPTQAGQDHYSLTLADSASENAALWSQLPPLLDGANKLTEKRGASILAVDQQDRPLLISSQWGSGRVMAFAGDSTWRWWLNGFQTAHKRFWRQTILWLARKDESMEGNVWVKLAQRRFSPAQRVDFTVGAQTPTGDPVKGATFAAEVQRSDGSKRAVPLVQGDGQAAGSYRDGQKAGDYTIRVTARQGEKPLGTAHARFSVIEQDLELDNAAADATLVSSLSAMTKGESVLPEELPDLIRRLAKNTQELEVQSEDQSRPCHTWPFFLLLTGLLAAEWYLRKRWGLV
jgi:hypothetical protein